MRGAVEAKPPPTPPAPPPTAPHQPTPPHPPRVQAHARGLSQQQLGALRHKRGVARARRRARHQPLKQLAVRHLRGGSRARNRGWVSRSAGGRRIHSARMGSSLPCHSCSHPSASALLGPISQATTHLRRPLPLPPSSPPQPTPRALSCCSRTLWPQASTAALPPSHPPTSRKHLSSTPAGIKYSARRMVNAKFTVPSVR